MMADIVFVGVTTGSSLVHRAMPAWQPLLGSACGLRGANIRLGADDETYVRLLDDLRGDDSAAGAVVTTHKVRLLRAARARFTWLDPLALACEEVNAIRRADGGLYGWARDPVSVGRVTDRIWPNAGGPDAGGPDAGGPDGGGDVICLGAGGTAVALAYHLFASRARVRFACADPSRAAVRQLTRLVRRAVDGHVGDGPWDDLVSAAPPGSLIVNATGMGKDRPGSPVTSRARFPPRAVIWELNYRGDLQFLDQARRQASGSRLRVHDGWQLFCHGWAAALTAVLGLPDDGNLGDRFAEAAQSLRPAT